MLAFRQLQIVPPSTYMCSNGLLKIGVYQLKWVPHPLKIDRGLLYTEVFLPKNHVRPYNLLRPFSAKSFSERPFSEKSLYTQILMNDFEFKKKTCRKIISFFGNAESISNGLDLVVLDFQLGKYFIKAIENSIEMIKQQ